MFKSIEETYGAAMTYAAAVAGAGVAGWFEENWLFLLTGISISVRIAIDIHTWWKNNKK